jgi:hypothetical protein
VGSPSARGTCTRYWTAKPPGQLTARSGGGGAAGPAACGIESTMVFSGREIEAGQS